MGERWVPVAPEDIRPCDTIRFVRYSSMRSFDVAEIDTDESRLHGTSYMHNGDVDRHDWWAMYDEWERLESDTANLNRRRPTRAIACSPAPTQLP